jgi:pilus assembly protein CpaB
MATRKRRSGLIFFLLALLLIVILVVVAYFMRDQLMALVLPQQPEQVQTTSVPAQVMTDIVVVLQPIKRGTVITEAMLGTVAYPQDQFVEGLFFTDPQEVIGKRVKYDLEPSVPLTPGVLTEGGAGSFLSFEIPDGMVAITIPINSARYAVSYGIKPGDHINILGSIKIVDLDQEFQTILPNQVATLFRRETLFQEGGPINHDVDLTLRVEGSTALGRIYQDPSIPNDFFWVVPSEQQRPRWVSQSIVQNVLVLYVGDVPLVDETVQQQQQPTDVEAQETAAPQVVTPERITVAVSQQDAIALNYLLLTDADINFVLRSAGDDQVVQTEPVTLQFIMDQYNIPYPAKLPYGMDISVPAPVQ